MFPIENDEAETFYCSYESTTITRTRFKASLCFILASYLSEQINERLVLAKLKDERNWLVGEDGVGRVILDVVAKTQLVQLVAGCDAGTAWQFVESLNILLARIFCYRFVVGERGDNAAVRRLIKFAQNFDDGGVTQPEVIRKLRTAAVAELTYEWAKHPTIFCGSNTSSGLAAASVASSAKQTESAWADLTTSVRRLRTESLLSPRIFDAGLCFSEAPKSFSDKLRRLVVCSGACDSWPRLAHPTAIGNDIVLRMDWFGRIVALLLNATAVEARATTTGSRPRLGLVTLCRSVRNGYTSRLSAATIESGVLDTIRRVGDVGKYRYQVVYEDDLFGGVGSWKDRHKEVQNMASDVLVDKNMLG